MNKVSIRELGSSLIDSQSAYDQQLGSFSQFLSPERKAAWHRINVERMLVESNANQEHIQNILIQGFQASITNLSNIQDGIKDMAGELVRQNGYLTESNQLLKELLQSIQNPKAIEAAEMANQARTNIQDAKELSKDRADRLLSEAMSLLDESISINDYDYRAHFDLGWLYAFYKNDLEKAQYHFDTSVLRSIKRDKHFAALALRHLADSQWLQKKTDEAITSIEEAEDLENSDNLETRYEHVRYLVSNNDGGNASTKLIDIIKSNPVYYVQARSDGVLVGDDQVTSALDGLKNEKLRFLENAVKGTSKNSNFRDLCSIKSMSYSRVHAWKQYF